MRLLASCLAAAVTVVFSLPSAAQAREPISPAALATLSGVDKALDEVATSIADEGEKLAQSGEEMSEPARFVQAWRTAAQDAFAADKLKASLAKRLTGKLNAAESNAVEDFYRSPLGARIVAAEVASGSQAGQQQMIAEAEKVMTALEKDAARKRLVEGIGDAVRIKDVTVSMVMNVSRAMMIGMASATGTGSGARMTLEDIDQAMQQQKGELETQMAAVTTLSLAFAYRDLPLADLEAYEAFLRTAAGAKYTSAVLQGMDAAMSEASLAFGRKLALDLGREPI